MTVRANEAYSHIRHVLVGQNLSDDIDQLGLINQAGHFLYSMHPWHFTKRRSALIDLRGQITITNAVWSNSSLTLTRTNAFASYTFVEDDTFQLDTGTNATVGFYTVASRTDSNSVVLEQSIGATATGVGGKFRLNSAQLPDDFRSIIKIKRTDGLIYGVELVTLGELLDARTTQLDVATEWNYLAAIDYAGTPPVPILELWPTPGTNQAGAFTVMYKKGWSRVINDDALLDFPEFIDAIYIQIVRAMAAGYEVEGNISREAALAAISAGAEVHAAKERDASLQWSRGRIRGGGSDIFQGYRRVGSASTPWRIAGPS